MGSALILLGALFKYRTWLLEFLSCWSLRTRLSWELPSCGQPHYAHKSEEQVMA